MTERYHPVLVALHWLLAALILFSLAMGSLSLEEIPNDSPAKLFALRGHMTAGVLILVLMAVRLLMRLTTAHPRAASTGSALLDWWRGSHTSRSTRSWFSWRQAASCSPCRPACRG